MAFTPEQTAAIESSMADFLSKRRPPEEIRDKLDLAWRVEGQSVVNVLYDGCLTEEEISC